MKIGIITIQKSEVNFGACLQSYALFSYLKSLGHNTEVVDLLRPCHQGYKRSKEELLKLSLKNKVSLYLDSVRKRFLGVKNDRIELIKEFNNLVSYSKQYRSIDDLYETPPIYDLYITGSDQVWNPIMPFRNDPYFLTFTCGPKISYASSFGVDSISKESKVHYAPWLADYKSISVREESGADIVEDITGVRPKVVMDPVFLLSGKEWRLLENPRRDLKEDFVFLYMLHYDDKVLSLAKIEAENLGIRLVVTLSEDRDILDSSITQLKDVGPREWLWLIDNAQLMLTTSFHGTAFSLILGTPFVVFEDKTKNTNSRITDMLSALNLTQNIVAICEGARVGTIEQYSTHSYENELSERIDSSKQFLQDSINLIRNDKNKA